MHLDSVWKLAIIILVMINGAQQEVALKKSLIIVVALMAGMILSSCGKLGSDNTGVSGVGSAVTPEKLLSTRLAADLEDTVMHPEIYIEDLGVYIQVQNIAEDLREIPEGVWNSSEAGSVALYVKVRAGENGGDDPFTEENDRLLAFESGEAYSVGGCLTEGENMAFLPPAPGYEASDSTLQSGDIREGWLICPAPKKDVGSQNFMWQFDSGKAINVWSPVDYLATSEWAKIPDGEIVNPVDGSVAYQGEVWMTLVEVELIQKQDGIESVPALNVESGCAGISVQNANGSTGCMPSSGVTARLHFRISYPEMVSESVSEIMTEDIDDYVLSRVPLKVGGSKGDKYIVDTMVDLPVSGWVTIDIPDGVKDLWVSTGGSLVVTWVASDARLVEFPSDEDYCADGKCIGPIKKDFKNGEPDPDDSFYLDSQVPLLCPGDTAMGVTIGEPIILEEGDSLFYLSSFDKSLVIEEDDFDAPFYPTRIMLIPISSGTLGLGAFQPHVFTETAMGWRQSSSDDVGYINKDGVYWMWDRAIDNTRLPSNSASALRVRLDSDQDETDIWYFTLSRDDGPVWRLSCD